MTDQPSAPSSSSTFEASFGSPPRRAMSRRRRTWLIVLSVLVLVVGGGAVVATSYYDSVEAVQPDTIALAQVTQVMAADGKTQLAQLGVANRIAVTVQEIPEKTRNAVIAGEDTAFYEDSWTGSAITRAYIRSATGADLDKPRLAVMARKMEASYSRMQILGFFLNSADFGRGAIGVETAARTYFAKHAAGLTYSEAALLGAVVHEPYGDRGGLGAYDPEAHPDAARTRWALVLDNMEKAGWISSDERSTAKFPEVRKFSAADAAPEWGITVQPGQSALAAGNIVNYVYQELHARGLDPKTVKTGGYRITTTIDPQAQSLLEKAARPDLPGSQLYGRKVVAGADSGGPQDLEAAGVVIDHTTGRVLAYYGGIDGTGTDLAGVNTGPNGPFGGHEPGASMQIYTLAAALDAGASLKSHWKGLPFRTDDNHVVGNGGVPNQSCKDYCALDYSLARSYHVPFYWVARQVGPGRVVKTAYAAGVEHMWNDDGVEAMHGDAQEGPDRAPFDRPVGFGQYPITVLDHAAGVSTLANGGLANKPHFVLKVEKFDPAIGTYSVVESAGEQLAPRQVIRKVVADDVTYAMKQAVDDRAWDAKLNGREAAAVPGVWNGTTIQGGMPTPSSDNAHAWTVGFTQQITVAVWTGNAAGNTPVTDPITKTTITGATPFRIWSGFVNAYSAAKAYPKAALAEPSHIGSDDFPAANGVKP